MVQALAPSLFIPHGGGPLPLLGIPTEKPIAEFLRTDARKMLVLDRALKAIIVVTAHWETSPEIMISSAQHHDLLYDYTFPQYPETYNYSYPAPGHPELARKIFESLSRHNVTPRFDPKRGWDHGTFIPMLLINPKADIPIVQVSIMRSHDTDLHWRLGQALKEFRKEGVAILGSGMTYHNMYAFDDPPKGTGVVNLPFDDYLNQICSTEDENKRRKLMLTWRQQAGALESHPMCEADHFMPFVVTAASGGNTKCDRIFTIDYEVHFRLGAFAWM